ncbi:PQQ-binding-like beta-propeller repeat protein [Luteolibacter marinus]|uniref:outer membrane protein assembly factor BamB family protein n=1 Tax=Luteolibacter marinus TaxID=2776705 RepID=UPI0018681DB6|nr:PQQ-binding-like beta-propeller repeat protein [Luteolibacter marinus]
MTRPTLPRRLRSAALLGGLLAATTCLAGDGWPQFRGPGGQGLAEGTFPTTWGPGKGVAWKSKLPGGGWSSPVIAGDKVILTGAKKDGDTTTLMAFALDLASGDEAWSVDLFQPAGEETAALHAKNSLASPTPVIGGDTVYVHFGHMGTAALALGDGQVRWKQQIHYPPMHGNGSSPILAGKLLVVSADAEKDPALVALDCKDGSIAWRTPRDHEVRSYFSFCTPLLIENNGRPEILSPASGFVGGYDPADGKLRWKVTYGEGYSVVPRPVVAGGLAFVATGYNLPKLLAIRLDGGTGDLTGSRIAWQATRRVPKTPSMIASGGRLLMLDDTGLLSALDAATGKALWKQKLAGNFSASPVLAGDTLYCVSEDGVCFVLRLSAKGATILSEIDMAERSLASPALLDGAIFLRTEEHLWKITGG